VTDQLARLVDIESIKQLKARYFRTLDTKAWDDFRLVFMPDIVIDVDGNHFEGRDTFVEQLSGILTGVSTVHHGHMPEITITGADEATGIWAMMDYLTFPGGGPARGFRGYGHYHETYRRLDGEWRIARLRLDRLRIDPLPGGLPAGEDVGDATPPTAS
jgi:uncharacterized protein (TIGR02246 family)